MPSITTLELISIVAHKYIHINSSTTVIQFQSRFQDFIGCLLNFLRLLKKFLKILSLALFHALQQLLETYFEPCQTSMMELFAKIVLSFLAIKRFCKISSA